MVKNLLFLLALTCYTTIQACNRPSTFWTTDLTKALDKLLAGNTPHRLHGRVLIAQGDEIIYEKTAGHADLEGKRSIDKDHQFVIGSITKQITATLILRAIDQGTMAMDDVVATYLKDIDQEWAQQITLAHLLNHTHGINSLDAPIDFPPGSDFAYSNLGYRILSWMLEAATGSTYDALVDDLFAEANMRYSGIPSTDKEVKRIPGFNGRREDGFHEVEHHFTVRDAASGSALSTVEDLHRWNRALHTGKLLSPGLYAAMTKPSAVQDHPLFGEVGYGYGLRITDLDGLLELGHTGYSTGYLSMNFYYPEQEMSVIVLENGDWDVPNIEERYHWAMAVRAFVLEVLQNM